MGKKFFLLLFLSVILFAGCREMDDNPEEGGRIYFCMETGGVRDIWSLDVENPSGSSYQETFIASGNTYRTNAAGNPAMGGSAYLVFHSDGGQPYIFDFESGSEQVLPYVNVYSAKAAPDQRKVLIISDTGFEVYSPEDSSSDLLPALDPVTAAPAEHNMASWAPDSERIVTATVHMGGFDEIFVFDIIERTFTQLTYFSGTYSARQPAWSPDGEWIAFTSNYLDPLTVDDVLLVRPDGSGMHRLTAGDGVIENSPLWAPDGRRIGYFIDNGVGSFALAVINSDGTGQKTLTDYGVVDFRWSPYGSEIVFTANWTGFNEIYRMDSDGGTPVRLTDSGTFTISPTWIPY